MEKVILVTGGSRGIGAAIAIEAAKNGYDVCINYHKNKEAAEKVIREIKKKGCNAFAVRADISKEKEVLKLFQEVDDKGVEIAALVNNASVIDLAMSLSEMSGERIQKVLNTNVLGTMLCSREAIKRMSVAKGGKGGSIVNISSGSSKTGSAFQYIDYAASKAAIDTLTIGLAKEVTKDGIRVNAIRPGYIETDMHDDTGIENRIKKIEGSVPMGRVGQPEEIAKTVMWLISENSSYTSGALIDINGGK